jgi:hypothetical protein
MDIVNNLLGFAVLTSPLWLLAIMVPLALWIGNTTAKKFGRRSAKSAIALLTFLFVLFVPFSDEIAGSFYFKYICSKKTEVKIYKTIELPANLWDERGRPKFYDETNGNFKLSGYRTEYVTGRYSSLFHIDYAKHRRVEEQSRQVVGEVTEFMYWGGWVRRKLSTHNTASSCSNSRERSTRLIMQIFRPREL